MSPIANVGVAYVDIKPELRGFDNAVRRGVDPTIDRTGSRLTQGLGRAFVRAAAIGSAAFATFGAIRLIGDIVDEAREGQRVFRQTEAVLKSTGGVANVTATGIDNLATRLSNYAGIDDEVIADGANMLLTFTNIRNEVGQGNDIFDQAAEAVVDLGARFGDTQSAAVQVGKALNDPIRGITALRRVGVSFTKQQEDQIKVLVESGDVLGAQKIILRELRTEFGGFAGATTDPLQRLGVVFENLKESIGTLLLPVLERLATFLSNTIIPVIQNTIEVFKSEGLAGGFEFLFRNVVAIIKDKGPEVLRAVGRLLASIGSFLIENAPRIADFLLDAAGNVARAGLRFLQAVGNWVDNTLTPWLQANVPKLVDFLSTTVAKGFAAGRQLIDDINAWIKSTLAPWLDENFPKLVDFVVATARDVEKAAETLIDGIEEWGKTGGAQRMGEAVGRVLGDALRDPKTLAQVLAAILYVFHVVLIELPAKLGVALLRLGVDIIGGIAVGLQQSVGEIDNFFARFGLRIVFALASLPLLMFTLAKRILLGGSPGFLPGLIEGAIGVLLFVAGLPARIIQALSSLVTLMFIKGTEVMNKLREGFVSGFTAVAEFALSIPGRIVNAIGAGVGALMNFARTIAGGFVDAFRQGLQDALSGDAGRAIRDVLLAGLGPIGGALALAGRAAGGEAGRNVGLSLGGDKTLLGQGGFRGILAYAASTPVVERASSIVRPGSITRSGNVSYHSLGRAVDFVGPNLLAIFRSFLPVAAQLKELIYTPAGFSIKDGRKVPPYAQADHYDHVHVALAEGGLVKRRPGGVMATMGEGRFDELVLPLSPEVLGQVRGGGGVHIDNLVVPNPRATAREVVEEVAWFVRTSGV